MAKKTKKSEQFIRITALADGFRRAGIEHFGTKEYPIRQFSKEQIAVLKEEPFLSVSFISVPISDDNIPSDDETTEKKEEENTPSAEPVGTLTQGENPPA